MSDFSTVSWSNLVVSQIKKEIIGQDKLIQRLLIGLICNQHILIEGVPGVAKTLTVNALAKSLALSFNRIQFTPDLLPSDLIGTLIYNPSTGIFSPKKGPLFTNIVLADEINRAPAKVQSALLEAMQERQVTIGDKTFPLDTPFMVLATQNPIDQEGTYPLPEAQIDRFMMKVHVDYPSHDEEFEILNRHSLQNSGVTINAVSSKEDLITLSKLVDEVFIDDTIKHYIVDIVSATRKPSQFGLKFDNYITFGASPRGVIAMAKAARAYALLQGRDWVGAEDVREIAVDVLAHRIQVSYEALAEEITANSLIHKIVNYIKLGK